tara:strand:+ start:364 stop:561 length:198 start_codon:yes stop_codon:yes gene_type:complete
MKTRVHIVLDYADRDLLDKWAKEGDRNISQQIGRMIRQENDRLEAKRNGRRTDSPPIKIAESVES